MIKYKIIIYIIYYQTYKIYITLHRICVSGVLYVGNILTGSKSLKIIWLNQPDHHLITVQPLKNFAALPKTNNKF